MLLAASLAVSIGACSGVWSHTSTDPSRSSFKAEVTAEGLIIRYDDHGRFEGTLDLASTSSVSYVTEEGDVEISDCGQQFARMTFGSKSYALVRVSLETGPATWCTSGMRGFFGIAASYGRLTDYGPSKSEFETQAEYRARVGAARRNALAQNRFLPILVNVYTRPYDADRRGFPFYALESDPELSVVTFVELPDRQEFLIPVDIDRARELRAREGSAIRATVFMVVEVDQTQPVETQYDPDRRRSIRTINTLRTVCMSAQFGDDD